VTRGGCRRWLCIRDQCPFALGHRGLAAVEGSPLQLDRAELSSPLLELALANAESGVAAGQFLVELVQRSLASIQLRALVLQPALDLVREPPSGLFTPRELQRSGRELGGALVQLTEPNRDGVVEARVPRPA
jgi:hypothetical protein